MEWTKDNLKEEITKAKFSQTALADDLGVHFKTVQSWEKVTTPIPASVLPALDKLFSEAQGFVPKEEYDKIALAPSLTTDALNPATELNKMLTNLLQTNLQTSKANNQEEL